MRTLKNSGMLVGLLLLTACVTINIYFPAAQAEDAAREMVKDILGGEETGTGEDKGAGRLDQYPLYVRIGEGVLNFLIPTAQAAEPNFKADSPEIRKIRAQMKKRIASLKPHFASGAIGFTKNAMVGMRDAKAIPLKQRAKVKKTLAAENKDRKALYKAIAKANGHPEWEADVQKTYARIWVEEAAKGWWYQNPKGKWQKK